MLLYIHRDGQQAGPYSLEDVQSQLRAGTLAPTDFAWHEGLSDWQPLSAIPGIVAGPPPLAYSRPSDPPVEVAAAPGQEAGPSKPNSGALIVGMLLSGFFALICLMVTLFELMEWGSKGGGLSFGCVLLGLGGTMAGISAAAQFFGCLRPGNPGVCQCCRRKRPTIKAGLNRHIGAILLMFHKSIGGQLCKECISKTFWEYTLITFFCGWWGMFSMLITPFVLTHNVIVYLRSLFMPSR